MVDQELQHRSFAIEEIDARLQQIIAFADIGNYIDQPVKTYSSGMFVRLAFSIVANIDPDILIIDEILGVGDAGFQTKCFERIEDFRRRGKTILLVSHSMDNVRKLCDRAMLVHGGRLLEDGPPDRVIGRYEALLGNRTPEPARK